MRLGPLGLLLQHLELHVSMQNVSEQMVMPTHQIAIGVKSW